MTVRVQTRGVGEQESHEAPAEMDHSVDGAFHDEGEDGDLEDEPKPKSDGRIKPGEVRNRYGRKGKPKKEKTIDQMMIDGLTKMVDVPQRDGSSQKMRLIQYFIETTIAQAFKGNIYQRLKFWKMLESNGCLLRIDEVLQPKYDSGISPELQADLLAFQKMFLPKEDENCTESETE